MKRTTVFLDETAERELDVLAQRRGEPRASLVREAIAEYLVRSREASTAALEFVAIGRSGRPDTADQHEELLFRFPDPAPPVAPEVPTESGAQRASARRSRRPR